MKQLKLALIFLYRDLKSGDIKVAFLALIIAVAGVTALSSFIGQSRLALEDKTEELLGGDLAYVSHRPIPKSVVNLAKQYDLVTSDSLRFFSMMRTEDTLQLVSIKAIDQRYPLKGQLELARSEDGEVEIVQGAPETNTLWLEPRLLRLLNVSIGDEVAVGATTFKIEKLIVVEPDSVGDRFSFAPRAIINQADVAKTEVIQPGSRIRYSLLIEGPTTKIKQFLPRVKQLLRAGDEIREARNARPAVQTSLDRGEQYLGLAALVNVILAGICVAITAQHFVSRHVKTVALMRCFGSNNAFIFVVFTLMLLLVGVFSGLVGTVVGIGLKSIFAQALADYLPTVEVTWNIQSFYLGVGLSVLLLLGFALPPLIQLRNVKSVQILRREQLPINYSQILLMFMALAIISFFIYWQSRDIELTFYVLLSVIAFSAMVYLLLNLVMILFGGVAYHLPYIWRFSLLHLIEMKRQTIIQLFAFGMALTVIFVMWLVRNDLLNNWQQQLPAETPNYFAINLPPEQKSTFTEQLQGIQIDKPEFYPIIRGRITHVNDQETTVTGEPNKRQGIARPLNVTWSQSLPPDNKILAGRWFSPDDNGKKLISIEEGFSHRLGLRVGDSLRFNFAGQKIQATIISIRSLRWDNFQPNFFVIFPPETLDNFAQTLITSFYVSPEKEATLNEIAKQNPSMSLINTSLILNQVRRVLDIVSRVVELLSVMTFVIGLLILLAVMITSQSERKKQQALIRALGANNRQLTQLILIEFVSLGLLAGGLAACLAEGITWVLAKQVFQMPFDFNYGVLLTGLIVGGTVIGSFALFAANQIFRVSPMHVLRG